MFLFSAIQGYVADLFSFLFGNVLAIGPGDLARAARPGPGRRAHVAVLWKELLYATFDPLGAAASGIKVDRLEYLFLALVAITIVVSLQAVGIILVVAMLVTPAATAQLLTVRFTRLMLLAAVVGDRQLRGRAVRLVLAGRGERRHHRAGPDGLFVLALVLGPRGLLARRRADAGRRTDGRRGPWT